MRIALVTHQFFPAYYTGVERATLNVAKQLARMGHECVVVTSAMHSSGDERAYGYEGVHVRPVRDVGRVLDEERVDVVDVLQPARLPGIFDEARQRGLPVVVHVPDFTYVCPRQNLLRLDGSACSGPDEGHACVSACRIGAGPDYFLWGASQLDAAAAVVCPSDATIDFHARQGLRVDHWVRIPWGVDYALHPRRLPAPEGDELVLGFAGTLLRHKGAHILIEAVRLLPRARIRLVLYGESFHERRYEQELRRLAGDDPRIAFADRYEQRDFSELLAPLYAVAIPSLWHENLPLVGLNAVAAGVPLLVSDMPGLRELVDEQDCGFTFTGGEAGDLAGLLERLLAEPELLSATRARMGYPAGIEEEAWRLETLYEQALAGREAAPSAPSPQAVGKPHRRKRPRRPRGPLRARPPAS
jgi:glycosyltransferase involved in cell wall biosynthesis